MVPLLDLLWILVRFMVRSPQKKGTTNGSSPPKIASRAWGVLKDSLGVWGVGRSLVVLCLLVSVVLVIAGH